MRFAQAHGAGKAAVEFVERKHLLLQSRAVFHQQIGIAHGQHAPAYAHRSGSEKRIGCGFHGVGELHTANGFVLRRAEHPALHIGVVGVLGAGGQDDLFAIERWLLDVHRAVERRVFLASNALAGVQHRVKGFAAVVRKTRPLIQLFDLEPVVQQKINGVS